MTMKRILATIMLITLFSFCPALAQDKSQTWSAKQTADYVIGAGDILDITTWKEAELTKPEVFVRLDGKISFPLVNDVQAAGVTTGDLKKTIEDGLKAYVSHPVVTVAVKNPSSQKFYVLGEVMKTGEYPLYKNMTVLQAFAVAGGFTQWATKDEILLMRREAGKEKIYRVNYKDITKGKESGQNLLILADDTIVVP
jgi:polysaccharide export outer membrane protein